MVHPARGIKNNKQGQRLFVTSHNSLSYNYDSFAISHLQKTNGDKHGHRRENEDATGMSDCYYCQNIHRILVTLSTTYL